MRKTAMYKVTDEGRDHGKVFFITEMSAEQSEDWAMRVMLAVMGNNVELPEGTELLGMAGLAEMGLKSLFSLKIESARPLLAEMLQCVQIIPDPSKTHVQRELIDSDIEEVVTRLKLRMEVFELHTGFSGAGALSTFSKKLMGSPAKQGRRTATSAK